MGRDGNLYEMATADLRCFTAPNVRGREWRQLLMHSTPVGACLWLGPDPEGEPVETVIGVCSGPVKEEEGPHVQ